MSYEEKNSYRSEERGYTNAKDARSVGKITGNVVASNMQREKENMRSKKRALLTQKEHGQGRQLIELGKLSSFIEHFDFIKVEEQTLPPIEKIENPKIQESFIKGYQFGKVLIKQGFTESNYHSFCQEYEKKYEIKKGINK